MIKRVPITRVLPGMWFHRLGGDGTHPVFVRHSFVLSAREIDALRRGGITEILIDSDKGLDYLGPALPAGSEPAPEGPGLDEGAAEPDAPSAEAEADAADAGPLPAAEALTEVEPEPEPQDEVDDNEAPDEDGSGAEPEAQPSPRPKAVAGAAARRALDAELVQARRLCLAGKEKMVELFADARMGRAVRPEAVETLVQEISESVTRHPDALISVARLKRHDDYTYLHSVAVCALMIALAKRLDLPEDQVREAGIGGMLHDIGKAAMPLEVLNKPGGLTDEEFRIMKAHPERGWEMLKEGGGASAAALEIALHHHEKFDGSGYPHGQSGQGIDLLSRMGAVCDVYDAISSNRPYKKAWSPAESIRRMAAWTGHFDPTVFQAFVKSLGIYPVGALVRLQSERLAVVMEQHETALLTPKVRVFYNAKHRTPLLIRDLDLAAPGCQDRIVGIESPEAWSFPQLEKLWMPV